MLTENKKKKNKKKVTTYKNSDFVNAMNHNKKANDHKTRRDEMYVVYK